MISSKLKMEVTSNKNLGKFLLYFIDLISNYCFTFIIYLDSGEHYHCQICDVTVHKNDRENHLKGAKHQYRIRLRESKISNFDPKLINS